MKRFFFCCIIPAASIFTGYAQQKPGTIELQNPAPAVSGLVELDYAAVAAKWKALGQGAFRIVHSTTGKEVGYQLLTEGSDHPVKILLDVHLAPGSKMTVVLKEGKPVPLVKRTYGRYVPERKEDFAWENDRIAFRMYGKALESTPKENAYGVDVWNKRTDKLVIDKWYKRNNYHKDEGEGLDYYHVGYTLGAGGIAPYVKDSLWYSKNYTKYRIIDSGALRTTFELGYEPWVVDGRSVNVTKTISLDAGAQLSKMQIQYSWDGNESLPVAVGIIKRPEPGTIWLQERSGIMGYWEPQHGVDGTTGTGCILLNPVKEMKVTNGHLLAVSATDKQKSITYYTGAAWDKAGHITQAEQWFKYLQDQALLLQQPVKVIIY